MPRKKNSKQYFTKDTEDAIIEYNNTDNQRIKDKIYKDRIAPAFDKLAEIVYNKWNSNVDYVQMPCLNSFHARLIISFTRNV